MQFKMEQSRTSPLRYFWYCWILALGWSSWLCTYAWCWGAASSELLMGRFWDKHKKKKEARRHEDKGVTRRAPTKNRLVCWKYEIYLLKKYCQSLKELWQELMNIAEVARQCSITHKPFCGNNSITTHHCLRTNVCTRDNWWLQKHA